MAAAEPRWEWWENSLRTCLNMISWYFLLGQLLCSLIFFVSSRASEHSIHFRPKLQARAARADLRRLSGCDQLFTVRRCGVFLDANDAGDAMKIFLAELRQIAFDSEGKMISAHIYSIILVQWQIRFQESFSASEIFFQSIKMRSHSIIPLLYSSQVWTFVVSKEPL